VPVPIALLVIADGALAAAAARDDGNGTGLAQRSAERVGIIAFVGQQIAGARAEAGEQLGRGLDVGDVARRQRQRVGAADDVGESVDFGGPAAARAADRLARSPPLPPKAERCALT